MERQVGPIDKIRPDHVARYKLAANVLASVEVLDLACGCGYGSWILQESGCEVTGIDADAGAIAYARKNYRGPIYVQGRAEKLSGPWEGLVSFETLEHLDDPKTVLDNLEASEIIVSVPNQINYPFVPERFAQDEYPHKRHYTPEEFKDLLSGYRIVEEWCQKDKGGIIYPGLDGMFMIIHGRR